MPAPTLQTTHAISIDAPAAAIWPWLAQMGLYRAGLPLLDEPVLWRLAGLRGGARSTGGCDGSPPTGWPPRSSRRAVPATRRASGT